MADYTGNNPEYLVVDELVTPELLVGSRYKPRKGAFILKDMQLHSLDGNPFQDYVAGTIAVELSTRHTDIVYEDIKFTADLPVEGIKLSYRFVDSTFEDAVAELDELLNPERTAQAHYNKIKNKPSIHQTHGMEQSLHDIENADSIIAALMAIGLKLKRSKYTSAELSSFLKSFNLLTNYQTKEDLKLYTNNLLIPEAINEIHRLIKDNRVPKGDWICYGGEISEPVDLDVLYKPFDTYWFVNTTTTVVWGETTRYLSKGDRVLYRVDEDAYHVIDNGTVRARLETELSVVVKSLEDYQSKSFTLDGVSTTVTACVNYLVDMVESAQSDTTPAELLAQTFTTNFPTNLTTDVTSNSSIKRFAKINAPIDVIGYYAPGVTSVRKVYPGDIVIWDKTTETHYITGWGASIQSLSTVVSTYYTAVGNKTPLIDPRLNTVYKELPSAINELNTKVDSIPNPSKEQGLELQWGGLSTDPVIDSPKSTSYIHMANSNKSLSLNLVNKFGGAKITTTVHLVYGDFYLYDGVNNCNYLIPAGSNYRYLDREADKLKVVQDKHLLDIQPVRTGKVSTLLPVLEQDSIATKLATDKLLKKNEVVFNSRSNDVVDVVNYLHSKIVV